MQTDVEQY